MSNKQKRKYGPFRSPLATPGAGPSHRSRFNPFSSWLTSPISSTPPPTAASSPLSLEEASNKKERAMMAAASFQTLLTIAEKALDPLPIWGPKTAIGIAGEVLKAIRLKADNDDTIREVQRDAERVLSVGSPPSEEDQSTAPMPPELQARLNTFRAEIESHLRELDQYQAGSSEASNQSLNLKQRIKQWLAAAEEALAAESISKALPEVNRKIASSIQNFMLEGQIRSEAILTSMHKTVTAIYEAQSHQVTRQDEMKSYEITNDERGLLMLLSPVKTAFHSAHGAPRACHEGTRTALLDKVATWFRDPNSQSIFWLSGIAGTGKTTIAQSICDLLKIHLGASFLFSRDYADRRHPPNILPTIAYQLAHSCPSLRPAICGMLSKNSDFLSQSVRAQAQELLLGALNPGLMSSLPLTLLVFDALDECDKENNREAGDFIPLLLHFLHTRPSRLKVLITSRPEMSIRQMLERGRGQMDSFVLHEIDTDVVQGDIEVYLRHELGEIAAQRGLKSLWHTKTREKQVKEIAVVSDRLFILAAIIVKDVKRSRLPKERIETLLRNIARSIGSVYSALDGMYLQVIRTVIPDDVDKEEAEVLIKTFQCVVGAIMALQQPLTASSLGLLLGVDESRISAIVEPLSSVLDVDVSPNRPIRIFHPSFPDYLTDDTRCTDARFYISLSVVHSTLAMKCLCIMNKQLKRDICNIGSPIILNSEVEDLPKRLVELTSAELRYACSHWWAHLDYTETITEDFEIELNFFTSGRLLQWIELLSLMGELRSARIGLPKAIAWCKNIARLVSKTPMRELSKGSNDFDSMDNMPLAVANSLSTPWEAERPSTGLESAATLLHDVDRMTQAFFYPISISALHIYESALTFMPQCFLLSKSKTLCSERVQMTSERRRQWNQDLCVMEGHQNTVEIIVVSPNGSLIASCASDESVIIWDLASGVEVKRIDAGNAELMFSSDSLQLLSLSWRKKCLSTWDVVSGDLLLTSYFPFEDDDPSWGYIAISPTGDYVALALHGGGLEVYQVNGVCTRLRGRHEAQTDVLVISHDGLWIASQSSKDAIQVWEVQISRCIGTINTDPAYSTIQLGISADSLSIIALEQNMNEGTELGIRISIWNIETQQKHMKLELLCDFVSRSILPLSVYNASLAYPFDNSGTLHISEITSGRLLSVFTGHTSQVTATAFSPDGSYLISGSDDCTIRIWDTQLKTTVSPAPSFVGHTSDICAITFSADGAKLISGSRDGIICCWDTTSGRAISQIEKDVRIIGFLADGTPVALNWIWEESTIDVWNAETGKAISTLRGHSNQVTEVAFSADFTRVVSGSFDNTVRVWNILTGECTVTCIGHADFVRSVQFSPDGSRIVSGSDDKTAHVWNAATGEVLAALKGHTSWVWKVRFSPDGSRVVSGSGDKTARLWDSVTGKELVVLEGHTDRVQSACFSPDGSQVASGSDDRTVRVWDAATGKTIAVLKGHTDWINSVQFIANGVCIVSRDDSGSEREWRAGVDFPLPILAPSIPAVIFHFDKTGWLFMTTPSAPRRRLCWLPVERRGVVWSSGYTVNILNGKGGVFTTLSISPTIS